MTAVREEVGVPGKQAGRQGLQVDGVLSIFPAHSILLLVTYQNQLFSFKYFSYPMQFCTLISQLFHKIHGSKPTFVNKQIGIGKHSALQRAIDVFL